MIHLSRLTYTGLGVVVFARQVCLPVPANLFLMAAGALAGTGHLKMGFILTTGVIAAVAGDLIWFEAGRRWERPIMRLLCTFSNDPRTFTRRAHQLFEKWGLRSLVFAKFVPGIDAITPPLAGIEGTRMLPFLLFDSLGALLWSGVYVISAISLQIGWTSPSAGRFGLAMC